MGVYDIFVDGKKDVQLKNFDCIMKVYNKGDKVPLEKHGYPKSAMFFCFVNPKRFVVIVDGIFKRIVEIEEILKHEGDYVNFKIWNCHGEEFVNAMQV